MRISWAWWDEWDDTALETHDSIFEPWWFEAEHATSRSRRFLSILKGLCHHMLLIIISTSYMILLSGWPTIKHAYDGKFPWAHSCDKNWHNRNITGSNTVNSLWNNHFECEILSQNLNVISSFTNYLLNCIPRDSWLQIRWAHSCDKNGHNRNITGSNTVNSLWNNHFECEILSQN